MLDINNTNLLPIYDWINRPISKSTSERSVERLRAEIGTTIGKVRKENQDRSVIARYRNTNTKDQSFVASFISDGIGGLSHGAECASLGIATVLSTLICSPEKSALVNLTQGFQDANRVVFNKYKEKGGATLTVILLLDNGKEYCMSVGDTRAYHIKTKKGEMHQITVDDTIEGQVKEAKGISTSEPLDAYFAGHITQFIGMSSDLELQTLELMSEKDDSYLLTSDGAHSLPKSILNDVIFNASNSREVVQRILSLSAWVGGYDNASLVYIPSKLQYDLQKDWFSQDKGNTLELWDSIGESFFYFDASDANSKKKKKGKDRISTKSENKTIVKKIAKKKGDKINSGEIAQQQTEFNIEVVKGDDDRGT